MSLVAVAAGVLLIIGRRAFARRADLDQQMLRGSPYDRRSRRVAEVAALAVGLVLVIVGVAGLVM